MKLFRKDSVHLPPALSLLVAARAREQGAAPGTIVREAVMGFAHLSPDVRAIHLHEFSWSELSSRDWVEHVIDKDTLMLAGHARTGCWSRHQFILAAVAWWTVAY